MKSYLITDPKYYSNDPILFSKTLIRALTIHSPNMVCFRDKESKNIEDLVKIFLEIATQKNIKNIFINNYLDLAIKYKAKGVHLTSSQFDQITLAIENGLEVIISCHNESEIKKAIEKKANYITYSPIYSTPNKGEPKGIEELKRVVESYPIKVIALGGIVSAKQLKELENTNVFGFASIRYFV